MALPGVTNTAALNQSSVAAAAKSMPKDDSIHPIASAIAQAQSQNSAPIKIDPSKIRWSKWGNRLEERFVGEKFDAFVEDIRSTQGNKTPGVVRKLAQPTEDGIEYELASGHRRHRACILANQQFYAFVRNLDDHQLQDELERENRNREDTAPMERALQYKRQLESYRSQKQMADAMLIPNSTMSRYLILADLPEEVINLITNRLEITLEAGCSLMQFIEKPENKEAYQTNLAKLQQAGQKLPAKEVLKLLRTPLESAKKEKVTDLASEFVNSAGVSFGTMTVNRAKQLKISIDSVTPEEFKKIQEALVKLLKR